jgi:hypothetical protein
MLMSSVLIVAGVVIVFANQASNKNRIPFGRPTLKIWLSQRQAKESFRFKVPDINSLRHGRSTIRGVTLFEY